MKKVLSIFAVLIAIHFAACTKQSTSSTPPPVQSPPPPAPTGPTVTSMTPVHGADSTLVTFKGVQFGTSGVDSVYFNGKPAKLISANDTVIVAQLPTLAGTGAATVVANGKRMAAGTFAYDTVWNVATLADSLAVPYYLTLDSMGTVYTTTYGTLSITTISPQGVVHSDSAVMGAMGILYDTSSGNFYLTQWSGYGPFVERLWPSGKVDTIARDSTFIMQIALDKNGNMYTANDVTSSVDVISPTGAIRKIGNGFYHPSGIAVTNDGTIYVAHYLTNAYANLNGRISKISPSGAITEFAQINYGGQSGLTLDSHNNLYATVFDQQWANGWVTRFSPDGTATKLTSVNLPFPCGIALDKSGAIYIAEQVDAPALSKGRVVKMTPH